MRPLLLTALLSLNAAPLLAQHELDVFAEQNQTFGVGATIWRGPLAAGLQVSGLGPGGTSAGDLHLSLAPGLGRLLPPGLDPYATAAIGLVASDSLHDPLRLIPTYSLGAGVRTPGLGPVRLYAELRRRVPLAGPDPLLAPAWSLRAGVRVTLGSGRPNASGAAAAILDAGAAHLDTRYVWGGSRPETGFDCSGFVQHVFAGQGVLLPRVSREQAQAGRALSLKGRAFRPGDLLFFASNGRVIDHVAIYAGAGRLLHATEAGGRVQYDVLAGWFDDHLVAARRVL